MSVSDFYYKKWFTKAWFCLGFILICRLVANYFIPLNDTTEARYGEIARKMLETGNWVTLQHDYGVPFWAKPPLSTWLSALSMRIFGVNEFAVRLPALLLSIAVLWLIWDLVKKHSGSFVAMIAVLVLAGALYFFIDAGAVMTEPALIFCLTLSFVAFWHAVVDDNKLWSYLFFVGLGLGLLAKGPIAGVLLGLPIFFWVLLHNQWVNLWRKLPWVKGTLLMLLIALPWYCLAEWRTPGFLNYFIVGEHIHRFLTPGWGGDKYGFAHHAPKGMIWVYAIAGFMPWTIVAWVWTVRTFKKIPTLCKDQDGWCSYLFFFMIAPLVFFTFASNIIYPYTFPALSAFAMLFAEMCHRSKASASDIALIVSLALICAAGSLVVTGVFVFKPLWIAKTQKPVINTWLKQHPQPESSLIYWSDGTEFSAQFYSHGKAILSKDQTQLCHALSNHPDNYLVLNAKASSQIPHTILSQFEPVTTVWVRDNKMLLLHSAVIHCS